MTSRWKDIETSFHLQLELPSSDLWFESYVHLKFSVQDFIVQCAPLCDMGNGASAPFINVCFVFIDTFSNFTNRSHLSSFTYIKNMAKQGESKCTRNSVKND